MALFGRKPKSEPQDTLVGLGPDYFAPETTSPADTYAPGRINPEPNLTIGAQWTVYKDPTGQWEDSWRADPERLARSRRDELFGDQEISTEQRKAIYPDQSYWNPPPNTRRVNKPTPDGFERDPYGHGYAPRLNGEHFSMASNIRAYEIYGQSANYKPRINTLRAEPAPMDINIVDTGPEQLPPFAEYQSAVAGGYSRSFRLG